MNSSGGTNELNDSKSTCFSISNSPAGDSLKLLGSMWFENTMTKIILKKIV